MVGLLLAFGPRASAREAWRGFCEDGNQSVVTSGISSTTKVQRSFPQCTVTVLVHGGGLATIYADNNGTPLANPFQANLDGSWVWYANDGRYDVQVTQATGLSFTYLDILLCDPFVPGAVCAGGTGNSHNLLSTTHLDTVPFSPPVRGDLIVAQNQTSPSGVNPAWARLPLGISGYVLLSNGTDALWGPLTAGSGITITNNTGSLTIASSGGGGCTLPSINTAVLSEHPAGTCYDSLHWTWDDGSNKQNMLLGDGTNSVAGTPTQTFFIGQFNTATNSQSEAFLLGDSNTAGASGNVASYFMVGRSNTFTKGADVYVWGESNTLDNTSGDFVSGLNNNLTTTTAQSIFNSFVTGRNNTLQAAAGGSPNVIRDAYVYGYSNNITNLSTTAPNPMQYLSVIGENNTITQSANANYVTNAHILGSSNSINDTLNVSMEIEIVGENNAVDGSVSTVQILGFNNTAHNVSTANTNTVNTTLVGSTNTATNTGASLSNAYQGIFGALNALSNCSACWIVGQGVSLSASNEMDIGMAATAALKIVPNGSGDNILRTPHAFSYYPACSSTTEGSFIAVTDATLATNGSVIVGSSTHHVLGYCDGTNWKVVVGT